MESKLLTVEEVAERTRLAKATIYKLASERKIPCQRMRRRLLFPEDQIEEWIANEGQTTPYAPKNDSSREQPEFAGVTPSDPDIL